MKGKVGGVAAAVFQGVEGGICKSWYSFHLFTHVFLILIFFRQHIIRRGGFVSHIFILIHSLLPLLIRLSYYSDFLFLFKDYRKRKLVAAAEEGKPGKEAARERIISSGRDETERRFERR